MQIVIEYITHGLNIAWYLIIGGAMLFSVYLLIQVDRRASQFDPPKKRNIFQKALKFLFKMPKRIQRRD